MSAEAVPVTPEQADAVAGAVARGFHDNEVWCWLVPDEPRRVHLMGRLYGARLRHVYLRHGVAYTTPGTVGGAFWLPPGGHKTSLRAELAGARAVLPGIGLRGARRGARMEALINHHQPSEPHWYLEVLSIDPAHQRQGHGAAMLAPVLERCDADEMPAYLETNRESNLPYYRRFGFELTEQISLSDGPPLWLMWRPPR